jgi:DNA repair protein RadA/Sms
MAKSKSAFFCKNCGYESAKWVGNCPSCKEWNTFVEEITTKAEENKSWKGSSKKATPKKLSNIDRKNEPRIITSDSELNRVLGGGIIPGSLILLGGEPGIGKSTLMLQVALSLQKATLYVSGEESEQQIKMRAERLAQDSDTAYFLTETSTANIFKHIDELQPEILVLDSIQTLHSNQLDSAPGSVGQVRHCAGEFLQYAKESGTAVFIIGHITKEGSIAGPKVLEHMVDTVIQFEGDMHHAYRIIRSTKNRFGSTAELGIYEMQSKGLRQVTNPSEVLIRNMTLPLSGSAIGATMEGNRPLLIEVQALVSPATFGTPQRTSTGFDNKRLNMLLAVLEKRGGFRLNLNDVFLNMAGGLKIEDPAIDLAVCLSIISSLEDLPLPEKTCFAAEVGLGGELRSVNKIENRISEAEKLGFEAIYIANGKAVGKHSIEIKPFEKLIDVFQDIFG